MMTVHEVSRLTGVSVRTLQYYDGINLLKPAKYTEAGYRLYDEDSLERLQQILLFRELEFPLKEIKRILSSPNFDREKVLSQQIELLTLKKEHLEQLISFARQIKDKGETIMEFTAFDNKKIEEYTKRAKEQWGETAAYKEFEKNTEDRSRSDEKAIGDEFMKIFAEIGKIRDSFPESEAAQNLIKKLQSYITEHYYTCTKEILASLGVMYAAGGEFTENIDKVGGEGTAVFTAKAIDFYCSK
ncbi:MAG: MerR family transcriptional regulator [Clostridia bacterium]|nr:MerR family transcriptional regulator [Clostridia bacterium]